MTPTKFLKRFLPDAHYFKKQRALRWLNRLTDPNVWHLNRRSVAGGLWIGIFCSMFPLPGQMAAAATLAIWTRANLPLAVLSTGVSNPLTFYPIYYFNFSIGCFLMGIDGTWSADGFSMSEIFGEASRLVLPLFLGSFIVGTFAATATYFSIRLSWRFYVVKRWWVRKTLRKKYKKHCEKMQCSFHNRPKKNNKPTE